MTKRKPYRFSISKTKPERTLKFRTSIQRTKYQPIIEKIIKLRAGQGFTIDIPRGVSAHAFHNRLNAVMRRYKLTPPAGCKFVRRTMEGERGVGIKCVKK